MSDVTFYVILAIAWIIFVLCVLRLLYVVWRGEKCSHCKCWSQLKDWVQWHQHNEEDYRGWKWCPQCGCKEWEGFQDRVFGC